jgi:PKD repeat protein
MFTLVEVCASMRTWLCSTAILLSLSVAAQSGTDPGDECPGCMEPAACNYDPNATVSDGSCQFTDCFIIANNDVVTVNDGDPIPNVLLNDMTNGIQVFVFNMSEDNCFYIDEGGTVHQYEGSTDCCGHHTLQYMICTPDQSICETAYLCLDITCPKPDCTLIDLSEYGADDALGNGVAGGCVHVCEFSQTTVFLPLLVNKTYNWNIIGGVGTPGSNDAEQIINWGPAGNGNISVIVTDTISGISQSFNFCVEIMTSPVANFTTTAYTCLNSPLCFDASSSTNYDDLFWDFGDGNTLSSNVTPCHTYNTPGTYTVILTAINYNYDDQGNPLCCCTDTFKLDVIVDELPGPNIYCISTLCEGDSACYSTDATNCSLYDWEVYDALGNPITFSGDGTANICVQWGAGPFGTITLNVAGCDSSYCSNPSSVVVPIISTVSNINGPAIVCEGATETYSVPKWISTSYIWSVTGATSVIDDSTHTITVTWGPAGVGTIHVDYCSSFLAGLPGHENPECCGSADLIVHILPEFDVTAFGQTVVCKNSSSFIQATNSIGYTNFDWTITPAVPFAGDFTPFITVNWPNTGTYVITAQPVGAGVFCNTVETVVITVVEQGPADDISGPIEVCPGDITYYNALTSDLGVTFFWTAQNGTVLSPNAASTGVVWGPSGPYSISVAQQMGFNPFCMSDTITLQVSQIGINGPLGLNGTAACTNSLSTYNLTPAQHSSAAIAWSIFPITSGSVVGGQGTTNATVQWNNDPGIVTVTAAITVCGQTTTISLQDTIYSPQVPVISQLGYLCPGVNLTLQATAGFVSYAWSNGSFSNPTTVSTAGLYSVTTIDNNGCQATAFTTVTAVPGPIASISSGDPLTICIDHPHTVTIVAQTNACYEFEWFCNGVSQGPSSPTSFFVHPFQGVVGSYTYHVVVTDVCTGCQNTSLPLTVYESDCIIGPPCNPEPYTKGFTFGPVLPNCNDINFVYTGTNSNVSQWYFGDGFQSGALSPNHTYLSAGCYNVVLEIQIPEQGNPGFYCLDTVQRSVCVPLAVDFDFTNIGCTQVQFNENSTWIAPPASNATSSYLWNFGFTTSALPNPLINFPGGGTYPVTLTVFNSNGCQASITHNVIIGSVGVPVASATPSTTWVGFPVNFSASATGAISYFWNFGDGATFTGATPQHSYTVSGLYNVTVTASDVNGCQQTTTVPVTIYPAIPAASITSPDLTICAGQTTTLTAPPGYTYLWSNGAVTQSITVGAGIYSVLITDANGCPLALEPVEVVGLPLPNVSVGGNPVICDAGCTTLNVPYVLGNTYQWYNPSSPIPGEVFNQIFVCDYNLQPGYSVIVVDQNGCTDTSNVITVVLATSPSVSILMSGTGCAGSPTTLAATPILPNVSYNWSNGNTGPVTTVTAAGTYTVFATDTITGCSGSASATIHPLPDLCIVPQGCYEACNPDTICGPSGLAFYQWNFNGSPIPGENSQCLIVTTSGTYTLTGTTSFGCSDTSGDLVLDLINCDSEPCDSLYASFNYLIDSDANVDSCCISLNYSNGYGPLIGFTLTTNDADFNVDLSSLDPSLSFQTLMPQIIGITSSTIGSPIPSGALNDFLHICTSNVVNSPQQIIINWYDMTQHIVCSDTIELHCPVEPDCLYMTNDSIYCDGSHVVYEFTVCNPSDAPFPVGYIAINPISPIGIVITPPGIDLTGSPILPGNCQTFTVDLSGIGIEGQTFCYSLVAHQFHPEIADSIVCCAVDTIYCIDIPICDPCGLVWVENIDTTSIDDCCYNFTIFNAYSGTYFDEIGVNVISPATTVTVNNPIGSGWTTSGYTGTSFSLVPGLIFGNAVPLGSATLPEICVQTNVAPAQQIEITWMHAGEIVCRDTIEVNCEPGCGYLLNDTILCDLTTGTWVYQGYIKNTASYAVHEAHFTFTGPGMSGNNTIIPLGVLNPGAVFGPFSVPIGAPAMAGDLVCFNVTLHEVVDSLYYSCCTFSDCVVLPDCVIDIDCECSNAFILAVNSGIICAATSTDLTFEFSMAAAGFLNECDLVEWRFNDGTLGVSSDGDDVISHTFPGPGTYQVCVRVTRVASNGEICIHKVCKTVIIPVGITGESVQALNMAGEQVTERIYVPELTLYPNPNDGRFALSIENPEGYSVSVNILDNMHRPVKGVVIDQTTDLQRIEIDLTEQAKGVYFIELRIGDLRIVKKAVVF